MSETVWFSARLRYAVVSEASGLLHYADSIRLLRSVGFDDAFARALELGRSAEENYKNADNELVAWRFVAVESLDKIGADLVDGQEVGSLFLDPDPNTAVTFETKFQPETNVPGQSL